MTVSHVCLTLTMEEWRYAIAMYGMDYVQIITIIFLMLFAKNLDFQKVMMYAFWPQSDMQYNLGIGIASNFLNLTDIPLFPFAFSCNGNEDSLSDCSKYVHSCGSGYFIGLTCTGTNNDFKFVTTILYL